MVAERSQLQKDSGGSWAVAAGAAADLSVGVHCARHACSVHVLASLSHQQVQASKVPARLRCYQQNHIQQKETPTKLDHSKTAVLDLALRFHMKVLQFLPPESPELGNS